MKKFFALLMAIFLFSLYGCNKTYKWEFEKDLSEIKQISIINIDGRKSAYEIVNIPAIKVVDNSKHEEFYNQIQNIKMTKKIKMELEYPRNYCFLIDYGNNSYCVLSEIGSGYIDYDEEYGVLSFGCGKLDFEKGTFYALVDKYLNSKWKRESILFKEFQKD